MDNDKVKIEVIIPAYNRLNILKKSLLALQNQSLLPTEFRVILVDDCSTDGTKQFCESILWPSGNLIYVRHERNKGLAATRNTGIRYASAPVLLFLDADIVADTRLLEEHLKSHSEFSKKQIAVISNVIYPQEYLNSNFSRYIQSREIGSRTSSDLRGIDRNNLSGQFFAGGASSITYNSTSPIFFNEKFTTYGYEDEDFGHRLVMSGFRMLFNHKAKVYHHDDASYERFKRKMYEMGAGSYRILIDTENESFQGSSIKYLIPVNFSKDSIKVILLKNLLSIALNKYAVKFAEYILLRTNKLPALYSSGLCRFLLASAIFRGLRSDRVNRSDVW